MNVVAEAQRDLISAARSHLSGGELQEARTAFEQALSMGPADAAAYNDYGRVLNNLRELDAAAQAFASAVALAPRFAEAHNNLGHVLRAMNRAEEAADCFRRAISVQPEYARAWHNLGTVLALVQQHDEAIAAHEQGLLLQPADPGAHLNLAGLYRVSDAPGKAEFHIREALKLDPDMADAWSQMASLLQSRGEIGPAMEHYRAALERAPLHVEALAGLADLLDVSGRYQEGLDLLAPALEKNPDEPRLAIARARLLRRQGNTQDALALLASIRSRKARECERLPRYFYSMGDLYDELGQYPAAMEAYRTANSLKDETFRPDDIVEAVDALISVFTPEMLARAPGSGCESERPVFIVGMPRSGTSLVEQMLAGHPQVFAAGELSLIVDMVRDLGRDPTLSGYYPECLAQTDADRLAAMADDYLGRIAEMDAKAARVTDKMPHNFLHLGLIQMLFPKARVIHCRRHPLDTILSCYFQDFASTAMAFSNDLGHLREYYLQYQRLMMHWRSVLALPMMTLRYERLVTEPEAVTRELLVFLDLPWSGKLLEFHRSGRLVNTASHAQVRKPLYHSSVGRHRHYSRYLEDIREGLSD